MNKSLKFSLAVILAILFALCTITSVLAQDEDITATPVDETSTTTTTTTQQNNVRLFLHKSVSPAEPIVNTNITFTITVINVGEETAYDIDVKDNEWPEAQFELAEGETKASFEKVAPNDRVSYKYTIVPKSVGEINTQHALATYRLAPAAEKDEKSLKLISKSNVLPAIPVMTQAEYDRKHASHVGDWIVFFILSLIPTALPYVVYMYANNQIVDLANQKQKSD
ncbi:hypothetical protein NAEGRDRAFT_80788 [Naegleria gruberi]|uniref:Uncharacterized protein AM23 n=1 Tax=Naegleria gruberi TaxID=5762 RepID=D2VPU2_NAEGR|nr:uncharacterized protein NAEGRDRAFT_80788 [Naegleria gruberi]EFC41266.1 hypothetical protein NAEGRDRAFT_80788 [Naegleria gruberi]|eukprot:XP_002674010.1 hypothetical protein NAEGRDRAFT_80788 [Naegleria gruberi strain NEG-M]